MARLSRAPGLRPAGDIDLCVRPEQYEKAQRVIQKTEARRSHIDLHKGFAKLDLEKIDCLFARSQLVKVDETEVRVLGAEDHLRLVCNHLLGHGACQAVWLCDVAVAVETRLESFDWQICFSDNHQQANWVACAILLAHKLLLTLRDA